MSSAQAETSSPPQRLSRRTHDPSVLCDPWLHATGRVTTPPQAQACPEAMEAGEVRAPGNTCSVRPFAGFGKGSPVADVARTGHRFGHHLVLDPGRGERQVSDGGMRSTRTDQPHGGLPEGRFVPGDAEERARSRTPSRSCETPRLPMRGWTMSLGTPAVHGPERSAAAEMPPEAAGGPPPPRRASRRATRRGPAPLAKARPARTVGRRSAEARYRSRYDTKKRAFSRPSFWLDVLGGRTTPSGE